MAEFLGFYGWFIVQIDLVNLIFYTERLSIPIIQPSCVTTQLWLPRLLRQPRLPCLNYFVGIYQARDLLPYMLISLGSMVGVFSKSQRFCVSTYPQ